MPRAQGEERSSGPESMAQCPVAQSEHPMPVNRVEVTAEYPRTETPSMLLEVLATMLSPMGIFCRSDRYGSDDRNRQKAVLTTALQGIIQACHPV